MGISGMGLFGISSLLGLDMVEGVRSRDGLGDVPMAT